MSKRFTSQSPIKVLYEDEHFMAFYKPAGLLSVPASVSVEKGKSLDEMKRSMENYMFIKVSGKTHMLQRWDESEPQGIYMRANHILSCLTDTTALRQAFISCTTTLCGVLNTDLTSSHV